MSAPAGQGPQIQPMRVKVFVDFWNLQLTFNNREADRTGDVEAQVPLDWKALGALLAAEAARVAAANPWTYEGVNVYASYNPVSTKEKGFHKWITTWLDRQPGVMAKCLERHRKAPPKCPACHRPIEVCPHAGCGQPIIATVEKGVDTLIGTDMIRLAWENAYDLAVLVSSDRDLVPAVEFLAAKGRKVIQAGFPPLGVDLATACWGSFDVYLLKERLIRPKPPGPAPR